tara:strand:- start:103 stop:717 length:615 start_codon:yes stop_codon:yes gene_type:complete
MATTAAPYGLVPVRKADGSPYSGARDAFLIIPAGIAQNIGYGSIVFLNAGFVELSVKSGSANNANNFGGAASVGAIGVFVGCEYVNSEGQLIFAQSYPSGQANATAFVITDPGVTFQAQAAGAIAQVALGHNIPLSGNPNALTSINTTTGKSTMALGASATTTQGFKIVGFSTKAGSEIGDARTDVLVKFNPDYHAFAAGIVGV